MKVRVTLGIGFSGANHEGILDIDDDEWADCETGEQKSALLDEYWQDWANNYIDGGIEVVE